MRFTPFTSVIRIWIGFVAALAFFASGSAPADEIMHAYEADALPVDSGWQVFDPCVPPCSEQIVDGHLVLEWPANFGDIVNYDRRLSQPPAPPPPTFWVEWRFKSLRPAPVNNFGCDAGVSVRYFEQPEIIDLYGDGAEAPGGEGFLLGLPLDTFRTFRFETDDAESFRFLIDGLVLFGGANPTLNAAPGVQFHGLGECTAALDKRNTWDYLRYGTIARGEVLLSSDPLAGILSALDHPSLDRFTVTFDAPNYVTIPEISVSVTGGPTPVVLQTRRNENFGPDTVEIVLDRALTVGETTTFTFDDSVAVQTVTYTVEPGGACCLSGGACDVVCQSKCSTSNSVFIADGVCGLPFACCQSDGSCVASSTNCCEARGGTALPGQACDGDLDGDGLDGRCGDECPFDPENDADGDGLCADEDECPDLNPNDDNGNGTPDCLEEPPIPTVSAWGLLILTLSLAVCARVVFRRESVVGRSD